MFLCLFLGTCSFCTMFSSIFEWPRPCLVNHSGSHPASKLVLFTPSLVLENHWFSIGFGNMLVELLSNLVLFTTSLVLEHVCFSNGFASILVNPTSKWMRCDYALSSEIVGFVQIVLLFANGFDLALKTILVHILPPNRCCSQQALSLKMFVFPMVVLATL